MGTLALATAKEVFDLLPGRPAGGRAGARPRRRLQRQHHHRDRRIPARRRRQTHPPLAAAARGAHARATGHGAIRLGAVVEMVHTATLVHDDIIDGAEIRRGRPSRQYHLGQRKVRPRRRLALHAGLPHRARREATSASSTCSSGSPSRWSRANCSRLKSSAKPSTRPNTTTSSTARPPASSRSRCGSARCSPARPRAERPARRIRPRRRPGLPDRRRRPRPHRHRRGARQARRQRPARRQSHPRRHPLLEHGTAADREAIDNVLDDRSFERVTREEIQEILHRNGSVDYAMAAADRYAEAARLELAASPTPNSSAPCSGCLTS